VERVISDSFVVYISFMSHSEGGGKSNQRKEEGNEACGWMKQN